MKKVNIIISTYNGDEYLETLLDSLFNQTYRNIKIYVRDDGSTDNTKVILQKYENKNSDIELIVVDKEGKNEGYIKSFLKALKASEKSDYYAFCDQDDFWKPDKIQRAITQLSKMDENSFQLYASGYDICDDNLNFISKKSVVVPISKMNVGRSFFNYGGGLGQGFTMVFNNKLKEKAFNNTKVDIRGHDVWLWAVASAFDANYFYDSQSTALYRRHNNSITPTGKGPLSVWMWRLSQFINGTYFESAKKGIISFNNEFGNEKLKEIDKNFLKIFGNNEKNKLSKLFYTHRLKIKISEEISIRISVLFNKI